MIVFDPRVFYILFAVMIIIGVFRFIKWLLSSIWRLLTGKRKRVDYTHSKDWLTRAQARQEIRMNNSLPPVLYSEMKRENKLKKLFKRTKKEKPKKKATDEKNEKFATNPDWKWDEETQLWRHRSQWDK